MNAVSSLRHSDHRYDIRPNRSLDGVQAMSVVVAISLGTLAIAGFLTIAYGAWPILPFAGLEVLVLAWGFWHVQRRSGDSEVLVVGDEYVDVTRRSGGCVESFRFPRHWVRVELERRRARHFPTRLKIGSHGRFVEIGHFLTDDERSSLAGALRGQLEHST